MARESQADVKKRPWAKIIAVVGALAGLASAIVPAWLAYLDGAEERAQARAEKAGAQAQKSDEKAELGYKLIRQQIEFLSSQIAKLEAKGEERAETLVQIRVRLAEMAQERRYGGRRPAATGGGQGGAEGASDELDDLLGGGLTGPPAKPEPPPQQQLPVDLEKEWAKSKKGE